ncbi:MAG: xanthine dehydrogenase family protein subunit M [Acidimicrobiia bacterium]|nr:xanthine dehydrogenase family protein subunit M [Acidimicrobiia bacterium]
MIPAAFDYVRAGSAEEAVAALAAHGDEAKLLAGGHSLIPLMRFRLARPAVLVDIGRLADLAYIREDGDHVAIGALTRHRAVETSELVAARAGLLGEVTSHVGDPQVRHRGTLGGAVAHGDPASDIPSALLALGATLVAIGPGGTRQIPVDDFFCGFLETALAEDEMLTEVRIPAADGATWGFEKFNRRAQDWAIVGVSAVRRAGGDVGVGLVNMHSTPVRAAAVESAVASGASAAEAAEVAAEGCEPSEDLNASVEYRQHLARVLTRRALEAAGL